MKIYLLAGEASGDLHGSNLAQAISDAQPSVVMKGWGGDRMENAGVEISKHYRELAFMGFWEVVTNLRTISRNFKVCKREIGEFEPDVLVLIDYPGFNLRMAEWAHKRGIRVVYYISPQVWAWKENRVRKIKRFVDRMLVILPFEKEFYAQRGIDVDFVGHPLLDELKGLAKREKSSKSSIAILPGSRKQEISKMLPTMLEAAKRFHNSKVVIAAAPSIDKRFYDDLVGNMNAEIVVNDTYRVLQEANSAMVTSGTATLEAGLIGTPLVVCYKGNPISYWIARRLVNVRFISLVNLIMDREVVPELIQSEMNADRIAEELTKLMKEGKVRNDMVGDLNELHSKCGGVGASARAADLVLKSPL